MTTTINVDNIPEWCLDEVEKIITKPGFSVEAVAKVSMPASKLAKWAIAVYQFRRGAVPQQEESPVRGSTNFSPKRASPTRASPTRSSATKIKRKPAQPKPEPTENDSPNLGAARSE